MPEGDTLHSLAAKLGTTLTGQTLVQVFLPRLDLRWMPEPALRIDEIYAVGKHLFVRVGKSGESHTRVLHTHLRMHGAWHLYKKNEPLRRSPQSAVAVITTSTHDAICFSAPTVEMLDEAQANRIAAELGPDLLDQAFDLRNAVQNVFEHRTVPLGVALMDQEKVSGIGNVWKSELLFLHAFDPFAAVGLFSQKEVADLLSDAQILMRRNVEKKVAKDSSDGFPSGMRVARFHAQNHEGPVSVYRREGKACYDCSTVIRMKRQGTMRRSTYYCPKCQPSRHPHR